MRRYYKPPGLVAESDCLTAVPGPAAAAAATHCQDAKATSTPAAAAASADASARNSSLCLVRVIRKTSSGPGAEHCAQTSYAAAAASTALGRSPRRGSCHDIVELQLSVVPETIARLRTFPRPLHVVGVIGRARCGKSTLCNLIVDSFKRAAAAVAVDNASNSMPSSIATATASSTSSPEAHSSSVTQSTTVTAAAESDAAAFESKLDAAMAHTNAFRVAATTEAVTSGMWMWSEPIPIPDNNGSLLVLDTEGFHVGSEAITLQLTTLTALLSSALVVMCSGNPSNEELRVLTAVAHAIASQRDTSSGALAASFSTPRLIMYSKDLEVTWFKQHGFLQMDAYNSDEDDSESSLASVDFEATDFHQRMDTVLTEHWLGGSPSDSASRSDNVIACAAHIRGCFGPPLYVATAVAEDVDKFALKSSSRHSRGSLRSNSKSTFARSMRAVLARLRCLDNVPAKFVCSKPASGRDISDMLDRFIHSGAAALPSQAISMLHDIVLSEADRARSTAVAQLRSCISEMTESYGTALADFNADARVATERVVESFEQVLEGPSFADVPREARSKLVLELCSDLAAVVEDGAAVVRRRVAVRSTRAAEIQDAATTRSVAELARRFDNQAALEASLAAAAATERELEAQKRAVQAQLKPS